jgi:hypothetical protein
VAIDHDTAIVGALGSAYIFERSALGNDWHEVRQLTSATENISGSSVAISGDLAIVGATGAAILFERNLGGAENWGEVATLKPTDPAGVEAFDFGGSVALAGETAVVASSLTSVVDPSGGPSLPGQGAVYLFERNSGGQNAWGQRERIQILYPPSTGPNIVDDFGSSIDARDRTLIVGAVSPSDGGIALVFERDDTNGLFTETATLQVPRPPQDPPVPFTVATDGVSALVRTGEVAVNGPVVYVFGRDQGGPDAWGRITRLVFDDNAGVPPFQAISIADGTAVVESRVFRQNQGGFNAWGAVGTLPISSDPRCPGQCAGAPVAVRGDTVVAGDVFAFSPIGTAHFFALDSDGDGVRDGADGCPLNPEHSTAGDPCERTSAGYALLDSQVSMSGFSTSEQNGQIRIAATFVNQGVPARNPFFVVTELSGSNTVVTESGESGVGATLTPDVGDGVWQTDEPATAVFLIRLATSNPFRFLVSLRGNTNPE